MKNRNTGVSLEGGNNRRQFLKLAGYGTLGLISAGLGPIFNNLEASQNTKAIQETEFSPDFDISLTARPGKVSIFPGAPTQVWRYHVRVNEGDDNRVIDIPRSYLGPIIKVYRGRKFEFALKTQSPKNLLCIGMAFMFLRLWTAIHVM